MTTLFISDLHLQPERPDITRAFERFLTTQAQAADALYILGDFFEVWIGDDDDSPFNQHIAELLQAFTKPTDTKSNSTKSNSTKSNSTRPGKELYLMVGNRDFLMGEAFASRCGATLLPDPCVIDLYGTPTLLMHGDSLCTSDTEYMAFREQARSEMWQQALLSKSLDERRAIARQLRDQSKSMSSMKAEDIMDVTLDAVVNVMQSSQVSRLIHGHTHRPAVHSVALADNNLSGERIVLGDWDSKIWCIEASADAAPTLHCYDFPNEQP